MAANAFPEGGGARQKTARSRNGAKETRREPEAARTPRPRSILARARHPAPRTRSQRRSPAHARTRPTVPARFSSNA